MVLLWDEDLYAWREVSRSVVLVGGLLELPRIQAIVDDCWLLEYS